MRELKILCTLNHPNVIRIYEFFETPKHLSIIINQAKGQPLLTELENHKEDYTSKRIVKIIWQLCKAIRHLKAKEIIWCNFNHNNIIYDGEDVVICGFSHSRVKVSREMKQAESILGMRGRADQGTRGTLRPKWSATSTTACDTTCGAWAC